MDRTRWLFVWMDFMDASLIIVVATLAVCCPRLITVGYPERARICNRLSSLVYNNLSILCQEMCSLRATTPTKRCFYPHSPAVVREPAIVEKGIVVCSMPGSKAVSTKTTGESLSCRALCAAKPGHGGRFKRLANACQQKPRSVMTRSHPGPIRLNSGRGALSAAKFATSASWSSVNTGAGGRAAGGSPETAQVPGQSGNVNDPSRPGPVRQ
ncbi:hypothetical protein V1517DRAFT_126713 [Lipomyces orientalis]|uniref:Uncharacterized protein n=1 Tax=Lipomyces orientalis TaxID=1233043 RepID=A0ACC3TZ10_9ASCO